MKIYLGGVSGNLAPFWKRTATILKEKAEQKQAMEDAMRLFGGGGDSALDTRRVFAN